jgi:hypothetical protein
VKRLVGMLAVVTLLTACQEHEPVTTDFTGNESTYALLPGSTYPISGAITFKEKKDGSAFITVTLSGTEGDAQHPVHIHLGNISTPDAGVTALLNPVLGKTGISETHLTMLADESKVSYDQLIKMNACVKVHLAASGEDKNIILAGGNIGIAKLDDNTSGRSGMRVCQSF